MSTKEDEQGKKITTNTAALRTRVPEDVHKFWSFKFPPHLLIFFGSQKSFSEE